MKTTSLLLSLSLGIALSLVSGVSVAESASNGLGVRGEVVDAQSRWRAGPQKLIVTDVTVRIDQSSQADLGTTVTFTVPGGELPEENLSQTVGSVPIFRKGQSVVVSLDRPRPDTAGKFVYRLPRPAPGGERCDR